MAKRRTLKTLRDTHDDPSCRYCCRFIGPGPTGWCELNDEVQTAFGICWYFHPQQNDEPLAETG